MAAVTSPRRSSNDYRVGTLSFTLWNSNTLATWCEELTHWERLWCWERLRAGGERGNREWDGWMASLTQWTWVEQTLGDGDGQGSLVCCSSWGCKELDMTYWLNSNNHWPLGKGEELRIKFNHHAQWFNHIYVMKILNHRIQRASE